MREQSNTISIFGDDDYCRLNDLYLPLSSSPSLSHTLQRERKPQRNRGCLGNKLGSWVKGYGSNGDQNL